MQMVVRVNWYVKLLLVLHLTLDTHFIMTGVDAVVQGRNVPRRPFSVCSWNDHVLG